MSNSQRARRQEPLYLRLIGAKKKKHGLPVSQPSFHAAFPHAAFRSVPSRPRTLPPCRPCSQTWDAGHVPALHGCVSGRPTPLSCLDRGHFPHDLVSTRLAPATKTNQRDIVSQWDRLLIFGACNLGALACFVICFFLFPVISFARPRKLVVL